MTRRLSARKDRQPEFTDREIEIATLLRDDSLTHKEVAVRLGLSPRTVESHVKNIRSKTGASTTASAISRVRARAASAPERIPYGIALRDFPE